MGEVSQLIQTIEKWREQGEKLALATVVAIKGSAYRRPGARMLVSEAGHTFGMIGGGCFDADVREIAIDVLKNGTPRLKLYNLSDLDVWGLGLGCNGSVYVLIESLEVTEGQELISKMKQALAANESITIQHSFSSRLNFKEEIDTEVELERVFSPSSSTPEQDDVSRYIEQINPPPRLVIFGAGHDVIPVVDYASQSGFKVIVVDQRPDLLNRQRFPEATSFIYSRPEDYHEKIQAQKDDYVLFMSHRIHNDAEAFNFYRDQSARYLGFLGPKRRAEQIIHDMLRLKDSDIEEISDAIYSPIGLDLGAETAEQVALSIVSELMIVKNNKKPQFLKDKRGTIHGTDEVNADQCLV